MAHQRRSTPEERRRRKWKKFWRHITEKLLSSRFNAYQGVMAILIAIVAYFVLSRFFFE